MPHGGLPVLSGSLKPIILRGSVLNLIELRLLPFVLGGTGARLREPPPSTSQSRSSTRQWHQMRQLSHDAIEKASESRRGIFSGGLSFLFRQSRVSIPSSRKAVKNKRGMLVGGGVPSICLVYGGDMRALGHCISSRPQLVQWCGQGFNQLHLPPPALPLRLTLQLAIQIAPPIQRGRECTAVNSWAAALLLHLLILRLLLFLSFFLLSTVFSSFPLLCYCCCIIAPVLQPSLTSAAPSLTSLALRQP